MTPENAADKETQQNIPVILLIEDSEVVYNSLVPYLKNKGYDVFVVTNYQDAIKAVQEFDNAKFDLAILDQNLLNVKNAGNKIMQRIKEIGIGVPVIGHSADRYNSISEADVNISKGEPLYALMEAIKTLLSNE